MLPELVTLFGVKFLAEVLSLKLYGVFTCIPVKHINEIGDTVRE